MSLQEKIIQQMGTMPKIDPKEENRKTINFMKDYLKEHSFLKTLILGISGGQDSTLLGKLAQLAVSELREELEDKSYQFIALRLPYGEQQDESDAKAVLDWIQADQVYNINIKDTVDLLVEELVNQGVNISDFDKGNIKARQRMIIHYAIASSHKGVVLGSDHAAESVTGFYTKFGDGASDLVPLYRLNKRQGVSMLKDLKAPARFYKKIPTADLQDNQPALPDEEELGVSYESIDDYLEGKIVSKKDQDRIEQLYLNSRHKRDLPINIFSDWRKTKEGNQLNE